MKAIAKAKKAASTKNHNETFILYVKSSSHLLQAIQATGEAISIEIQTSFIKSFDNKNVMLLKVAPNVFRMPISLVRCRTVYADSPINPAAASMIAIIVNILSTDANRVSEL